MPENSTPVDDVAGNEEVDVAESVGVADRAAEDVAEDEQEHRALHRGDDEQLWRAHEVHERAPGDDERAGDEARRLRGRGAAAVAGTAAGSVVTVMMPSVHRWW